jgi:penicillin G amidase
VNKRIGLGLFFLVFILSIMTVFLILNYFIPTRTTKINSIHIKSQTEIIYDNWAIPHIYANNEHDAYYSLGFVHAQERLFQMEMLRRVAKGELSEIFGIKALDTDKFFRTMRIRSIAKEIVNRIDKNTKSYRALLAYLAGINEYIKLGKAPLEYKLLGIDKREFSEEDIFSITGYMAFSFLQCFKIDPYLELVKKKFTNKHFEDLLLAINGNQQSFYEDKRAQNFIPIFNDFSSELQDLVGIFPLKGSNGWVVSGQHTKSGKPILANDPHVFYSSPGMWYEAHISTPKFELYGHHIAGVPTALLGHNRNFAWGITMLQNQDVFFFEEEINPNNNKYVKTKNKWEKIKTDIQEIFIKNNKSEIFPVLYTSRGPIINSVVKGFNQNSSPVSMWWAFSDYNNDLLSAFYGLAHANSVKEVPKFINNISSPGLNIICADDKNNIAWWTAGKMYLNKGYGKHTRFLDSEVDFDIFNKSLTFEKHPFIINPREGLIVSANNDPVHVDDKFNNIIGYYSLPQRYNRIIELIKDKKLDYEDMKKIQLDDKTDMHNFLFKDIFPVLTSCKEIRDDKFSYQTLKDLIAWDGRHDLDNYCPTVFYKYLSLLLKQLFYNDSIDQNSFQKFLASHEIYKILNYLIKNKDSIWWQDSDGKTNRDALLIKVWKDFIDIIKSDNKTQMAWKNFHNLEHKHILGKQKPLNLLFNVGPFPIEGGNEVINNQEFYLSDDFSVIAGPSTRIIIDMSRLSKSYGILPTGQSGYFYDKHYKDQTELYNAGKYRYQLMDREDIEKVKKYRLLLQPLS